MAKLVAPSKKGTRRYDYFEYNFANDGGVAGSYKTGLSMPGGSLVLAFGMFCFASLNSAAPGTTIDIQALGVSILPGGPIAFSAVTIPTTGLFYNNIVQLTAVGFEFTGPDELSFVIGMGGLTAGHFQCFIDYVIPQ